MLTLLLALPVLITAQPALEDRTIEVSGVALHMRCGGERGPGSPVVVLEAGAFNSAETWRNVHGSIAQFARVCAHDRPGPGTSASAPDGLTPSGYIALLRDLLKAAGESPPYVMVGHSMGGLIAMLYAVHYPSEVAGMVLVDSSHEDQLRRFAALPRPPAPPASSATPAPRPEAVPFPAFVEDLARKPWRGNVPLVVLTATRPASATVDPGAAARQPIWQELQRDLATRSPKSMHAVATNSGHYIQNDAPALVIDAVRDVLSGTAIPSAGRNRDGGGHGARAHALRGGAGVAAGTGRAGLRSDGREIRSVTVGG